MNPLNLIRFPMLSPLQRFVLRHGAKAAGIIFMLHRVHPVPTGLLSPNENMNVSPEFLDDTLTRYRRQGFDFISLDELHARLSPRRLPARPFIAMTMDDGYRDNYDHALPIFEAHRVPFAVYVTTNFPDHKAVVWWYILDELISQNQRLLLGDGRVLRCGSPAEKTACFFAIRAELLKANGAELLPALKGLLRHYSIDYFKTIAELSLSWDQIRTLSRHPLCTIGGHSITHSAFNRLSEADIRREVTEGNALIESHTGRPIEHFCYPFGSRKEVGEREFELLRGLNLKTVTRAGGGLLTLHNMRLHTALPRVMLRQRGAVPSPVRAGCAPPLRHVYFVKRVVADYQVPFLLRLQSQLAERQVSLTVLAGAPSPGEGLTDALDQLPFGIRIETRQVGWKAYLTHNAFAWLNEASLILLEQANAQLINYPILIARAFGRPTPVAFVGHGAHFSLSKPAPFRDAWRNFWLRRADWFFAYTEISARRVAEKGFPGNRVTVFQNAVDTDALTAEAGRLTDTALNDLRRSLFGDTTPHPTGLYCARLVKEKEIPFLLESLALLHDRVPSFRMILIGDGPERDKILSFCSTRPWCRWVGRINGVERVPYFKLADVLIYPSPIGLAILDAFALGLPVATTDNRRHGPEIAYLSPGANGLLAPPRPDSFAEAVASLLNDPARLAGMRAAARDKGRELTVARMAELFAGGIDSCLKLAESPPRA